MPINIFIIMDIKGLIKEEIYIFNISETQFYLNKVVKKINFLTEDGKKEPDMEWDLTDFKKDIDNSKKWVKTTEDIKQYLKLLFQKLKNSPKNLKNKVIKYVLVSFLGFISLKGLNNIINDVSDEKIEVLDPKSVDLPSIEVDSTTNVEKEPKIIKIRSASDSLVEFLKEEEKFRALAYKLGDGMVTIGYGHAEYINKSDIIPYKTRIDRVKAEEYLRQDIKKAEGGLNKILDKWEQDGLKHNITQNQYDAMISMIFNMGRTGFRRSEFIKKVKEGDMDAAHNQLLNTSSQLFKKFPGLKKRRQREAELFSSSEDVS